MGFITKNANMILLFLIMLSAASLVGATVFFQMNFEKINTEYNQKAQQLQQISKDLQTQQALLDKIKGELSTKTEREQQLGEQFTGIKSEKEQLQTEKSALESSKEQLTAELETTSSTLQSTQNELEAKKTVIDTLTADNNKLSDELSAATKQRDDYKSAKDACETAKAKCTCP